MFYFSLKNNNIDVLSGTHFDSLLVCFIFYGKQIIWRTPKLNLIFLPWNCPICHLIKASEPYLKKIISSLSNYISRRNINALHGMFYYCLNFLLIFLRKSRNKKLSQIMPHLCPETWHTYGTWHTCWTQLISTIIFSHLYLMKQYNNVSKCTSFDSLWFLKESKNLIISDKCGKNEQK